MGAPEIAPRIGAHKMYVPTHAAQSGNRLARYASSNPSGPITANPFRELAQRVGSETMYWLKKSIPSTSPKLLGLKMCFPSDVMKCFERIEAAATKTYVHTKGESHSSRMPNAVMRPLNGTRNFLRR